MTAPLKKIDWNGLSRDLVKVVGACLVAVLPVGLVWVAKTDADHRAEWDAWCHAQGGEIVSHERIPPDQVGSVVRARYCVVAGKVVGSR